MRKGNVNNDKFKVSKLVIIGTFFLFLLLIGRLCYLCLVDYKVGNSTIAAFIKNRNTKEDIIMPKRGTIYDINGNVITTYTGKFDIETDNEKYILFDDEDGLRHIIYYTTGTVIVNEVR